VQIVTATIFLCSTLNVPNLTASTIIYIKVMREVVRDNVAMLSSIFVVLWQFAAVAQ
jgi:hypothetical protein